MVNCFCAAPTLPRRKGGISFEWLFQAYNVELGGSFLTLSLACRVPSGKAVNSIFRSYWCDSTRELNPGLVNAKQTL